MVMQKLIMSNEDHARVSAAVHAAEGQTSGEIVTIVADHSDRYLDVALWLSGFATILALALAAVFPAAVTGFADRILGDWNGEWGPRAVLELALAIAVLVFALCRLALQWIPLRLVLTPGIVKARRVRRRAIRYFKVGAEHRTAGRTGILIYLSLTERRAEIVADAAILKRVDDSVWGEAMEHLLSDVREGRIAEGMITAVNDVGAILAEHFPKRDDDSNELPDRLIEL
jgi:putative membrane protein